MESKVFLILENWKLFDLVIGVRDWDWEIKLFIEC